MFANNGHKTYNKQMKFRTIAICLIALIPVVANASEQPLEQAQAPQSAVGASDLLPQSSNSVGGTSSTGAGSVLQPNASSLQGSTTDGSSLSAPSDQVLQAGPSGDGLKVLLGGEADGSPRTLSDRQSNLGEEIVAIAGGILILCVTIGVLRRRVLRPLVEA